MHGDLREVRCSRYHRDGARCENLTRHADGWCRQPDCGGFLRRSAATAPEITAVPPGTRRRTAAFRPAQVDLSPEEAYEIRVSLRARDSFRFHHGGSDDAAEAQIRSMLEDFLLESTRTASAQGFVRLTRSGYALVLSPDGTVITGYSTVHRERTWAQVRAGVPSRFGRGRGHTRPASAAEQPPQGEPLGPDEVPLAVDPVSVHLTSRTRTSFERIFHLRGASDRELDDEIRRRLTSLPGGRVTSGRGTPGTEVAVDGLRWLIRDDARVVIGVARAPAEGVDASSSGGLAAADGGPEAADVP